VVEPVDAVVVDPSVVVAESVVDEDGSVVVEEESGVDEVEDEPPVVGVVDEEGTVVEPPVVDVELAAVVDVVDDPVVEEEDEADEAGRVEVVVSTVTLGVVAGRSTDTVTETVEEEASNDPVTPSPLPARVGPPGSASTGSSPSSAWSGVAGPDRSPPSRRFNTTKPVSRAAATPTPAAADQNHR
jgi:hypothetical protein